MNETEMEDRLVGRFTRSDRLVGRFTRGELAEWITAHMTPATTARARVARKVAATMMVRLVWRPITRGGFSAPEVRFTAADGSQYTAQRVLDVVLVFAGTENAAGLWTSREVYQAGLASGDW